MKINEVFAGNVQKNYLNQKKQHENLESRRKDSMDISSKAQDIQKIKKELKQIPEVREEKVSELKSAFENNEYQISSKKIAQKILSSLEQE